VLAHIDALVSLVSSSDLADVLVHADLAPGNVLIAGRRVVVLDFAMTHRGSLMQDISRLYVQMDLMRAKPQFRRQVIHALQKALLRGFDPGLTKERPLFRLMLLRHHVNHLLTLNVRRERFPAAVYNAHLRRLHRQWIARELSHGVRGNA
jgi:Ser/Thr protein kinase RdoA (MazF antagonist)